MRLNHGPLMELGLVNLAANNAHRFLDELRGFLAVGTLEPNPFHGEVSSWRHDDFDGGFHRVERTSLMEPLGCGRRWTLKPLRRASMLALWTP